MAEMKGKIGVTTENIFPVIKKFLYSDHEIFLRELVANAVDASQKLKALSASSEFKGNIEDIKIAIELDEEKKILKITDQGIGMTEEEVEKYINQIAFSSAGDFLEKYKDNISNIIGHFGLGFYSAFMVAEKVSIDTLSWKEGSKAVKWTCDGSPEYQMQESDKTERGTTITLYLDEESKEFAAKSKIDSLLAKYCKFMPVPIVFGKEQEYKDGKQVDTENDKIINKVEPLWSKSPSELKEEDYMKFYRELYPMEEEPLFHIHLNVDYPFNLTGVLYFPKIKERMSIKKNQIGLYCNQMFVTDHVENIVPEFLTLLHGVIDSPDIPLNVSRSYLQSDSNVKKISTYITKKVADRLEEIFKNDREQFESKWDNLKLFMEYGMLSDEKFYERASKFALFKNVDGKFFSFEDYRKAVEGEQTDKDKKVVYLYATNLETEYQYIEAAKNKGYDVLLMDSELDSHYVNLLETKLENTRFARVDSDSIDNLIPKEDKVKLQMSEAEEADLRDMLTALTPEGADYMVTGDNLGKTNAPIVITQSEFMRRYREMSSMGGGMNFYGSLPESYNLIVNMENPLIAKIMDEKLAKLEKRADLPATPADNATDEEKNKINEERDTIIKERKEKVASFAKENDLLKQLVDLSLLSTGLLKGKALSDFIARSHKVLEK